MLATAMRRIRPIDEGSADGSLDSRLVGGFDDSVLGGSLGGGLDDPYAVAPGPTVRPFAPPTGPAPGTTQPIEAPERQAMLTDDGGTAAITQFPAQLPDGNGGVINVPPVSMAPPSVGIDTTPSIPVALPQMPVAPAAPAAPSVAPPTAAAPAAPPVPAPVPASPGTFNADDNLIASQVLPGANPRLLNMQGLSDEALQSVLHGPDRLALAKQYLDADVLGLNEQYAHDRTDATNDAGVHGRLGSGVLTNRYGDLFSGITAKKKALETRYLTDAAAGTIGDRRAAYDAASGAEGRVFGEGVSDRGEVRTERGYEAGLAQQALLNRILQSQAEQGANQQDFQQALQLLGLGNLNNPESAYETAAGQASGEAAGGYSAIQQLLAAIMSRRGAPAAAGG